MRKVPHIDIDRDFWNRLLILTFSVLFALFLWFQTSSKETYEAEFSLPLTLKGVPPDLVITSNYPENASVRIQGDGKTLLRLHGADNKYFNATLDVSDMEPPSSKYFLSESHISIPSDYSSVNVLSIYPSTLNLKVEEKHSKSVKVVADSISFQYKEGFVPVGDLQINPNKVTVFGPEDALKEVNAIQLEPTEFENVDETVYELVECADFPQRYFSNLPDTVLVTQKVEPLKQRIFPNLPVHLTNVSPQYIATVDPQEATIVFSGAVSHINALSLKDVSVIIDAQNLDVGQHSTRAEIKFPEKEINLVEVKPRIFEVKLTRK
jgi:YbbR domain-containing protein